MTIYCVFLSCHVRVSEWIHTLYLPECQGTLISEVWVTATGLEPTTTCHLMIF